MIPKIIHQIWFQGWDKLPDEYQKNVQSVIDHNPGYKHIKWDDKNIRAAIQSIGPEYLAKYDNFKLLHQKIDFGRYAVLYLYGGISVDVDCEAVKGFDELPQINTADFIVSRINVIIKSLNNATILVKPKHPLLRNLLDLIPDKCGVFQTDFSCIRQTTGPAFFTKYLSQFPEQITFLDNSYFENCSGMDSACQLKPNSILNHKHALTWVPPIYVMFGKGYYKIKQYKIELILLFSLLLLAFLLYKILK